MSETSNIDLGTPVQRYEKSGNGMSATVLTFFFGVLVGAVALYGAYFSTFDPLTPVGANIFFGIIGVIAILAALGAAVYGWLKRGLYVQIYANGLKRVQGGKEQQVRWDDINAVWQQITNHTKYGHTMYTTHIYTLETKDKRVLEFGADLKGTAKLGKTLVEEVNKRLYPQMVADYNAGQTVAFEPFTLSKEGVGHKNKYLSWAEIEGAQIDKGYVTFKKQGKWFNWVNVPAAQIPNVLIFLALVDYAIGLKRGAEYSH